MVTKDDDWAILHSPGGEQNKQSQ